MSFPKLKLKKGDTVKVLSGKDRGKTGKVIAAHPRDGRVTVEGVNLHTRFEKSRKTGQPGTRVTLPGPMPTSKVQLVDPSSGKPSRVGYEQQGTVKQRIAKKSGKAA